MTWPFFKNCIFLQVAVHTLQFLNELVTLNVKALGSSALLGVVTAVTTYAVNGGPLSSGPSLDARLQAAHFLQFLAQTNLLTAQLLLTCQVFKLWRTKLRHQHDKLTIADRILMPHLGWTRLGYIVKHQLRQHPLREHSHSEKRLDCKQIG